MTIAIDCRALGSSGIGVYLQGCLPCFPALKHNFLLFGNTNKIKKVLCNTDTSANTDTSKIEIIECTVKVFSPRELFFFPKSILKKINAADIFYSPFFNIPGGIKIPVYTTIHDVIFPDMPELTNKTGLALRMFFFKRAVKRSKKIFTVSKYSASRIKHYFGDKVPVVVTYAAIQEQLLEFDHSGIQKENIIMFIGNIKKHKGLGCLLEAFFTARNEGLDYKLVIAGEKNNFRTKDKNILRIFKKNSASNESALEFLGAISDDELRLLLCKASLLVQPSLYEGFCAPPLEALVCGTKVLLSDIPVLREIYADFPVNFFKAGSPSDLKEKLVSILKDENRTVSLPETLRLKYTFKKVTEIIAGAL
ncbi:MAG: glycosyltransferase family 4 protein [Spirochaetaceae bacterium]|jgi:glycosyltransferase involved in cell wall biosynthesis|nr:glycosyltransferase family 4 protein [Spirochaetaceae bacterium]